MIDVAALIALNMPGCVFFYSKFDAFLVINFCLFEGRVLEDVPSMLRGS